MQQNYSDFNNPQDIFEPNASPEGHFAGGTQERVRQLRKYLAQWERQGKLQGLRELGGSEGLADGLEADSAGDGAVFSTGCRALDRRLPGGGWRPGQLVEWFIDGPGSGVELLVLQGVRALLSRESVQAGQARRTWVVMDRQAYFYPPAILGGGLELSDLVVVRPQSGRDELWALDQVLRCPAVALVLAWLPQLTARDFRRLQLAVEEGGVIGCLIRPASAQHEPSWSDLQVAVQPLPLRGRQAVSMRAWQLQVLRCRGGRARPSFCVELDEDSGRMHELAGAELGDGK